jgi:endonuclease/exonuclease/phosphatase family metal-dependent hydrolase
MPPKQSDRVLIATWNIANLGVQERRDKDYQLLAEILGWFDLIALQEVNDNLTGLRAIHQHLGADYRLLFSDASGNDERMTFVYDATKLALLEEVGEVAPPPSDYRHITLPGIQQRFDGFPQPLPGHVPNRRVYVLPGQRPPVLRLRQRGRPQPAKP